MCTTQTFQYNFGKPDALESSQDGHWNFTWMLFNFLNHDNLQTACEQVQHQNQRLAP